MNGVIAVTPTLFAGKPGDLLWLDDLLWAGTVGEAVILIKEGKAALIDVEGWEQKARTILGILGAEQDHIEWAIRTAPRVNENRVGHWPDTLPFDF
jgi:hypothetical protein